MLRRLFESLMAALGGVAGSAWPSFLQQYRVGIANRIDELARVVVDARLRPGAMGNVFLSDQERRLDGLRDALAWLDSAGPIGGAVAFVRGFDAATLRTTWERFEPALQFGWAGTLHLAAGALAGLALASALGWPVRRWRGREIPERWS